MSLRTGARINRNRWTALPLPSTVKLVIGQLANNNPEGLDICDRNGRALALDDDEVYISDEDSTYDASNNNNNIDELLIHDEYVSNNEINKNNIALENNADMYLQHNVIAGVRYENDPRPDIEASGIPNDDVVGVPIAEVNDGQQQELENNENAIQQIDNNNYISDDEGDGNNQPDYDAQTENEADASDTDKDEVDKVIT